MRKMARSNVLFVVALFVIIAVSMAVGTSLAATTSAKPAAPVYLWSMETDDEISDYGDDNTGSTFALAKDFVVEGKYSCKLTPSGDAQETKMALALEGKLLPLFLGNDSLLLNLYIPAGSKVKPNTFFMGMADVAGDWKWVDGIFSQTEVKVGWNKIVYPLSPAMKDINEDGRYTLYFSFFNKDDSGKTPLADAIYLDGIWMEKVAK